MVVFGNILSQNLIKTYTKTHQNACAWYAHASTCMVAFANVNKGSSYFFSFGWFVGVILACCLSYT